MPSRNGKRRHASMYDFRDLDIMLTLEERADEEGWAEIGDLASQLGFGDDLQPLAIRLSWMRRYGILAYDERHHRWRHTDSGLRVVEAKLRAADGRAIDAIPEESLIDVMANVTKRYHSGDPMIATMLRREFMYGTQRRR